MSKPKEQEIQLNETSNKGLHNEKEDRDLIEFSLKRSWETPEYKLKHFVGNSQITPYAKLKQWIRELKTREECVESMEHQKLKHAIDLKIEEEKLDYATSENQKALARLDIHRLKKDYAKFLYRLEDSYTERATFLKLINELLESPEGKLPDGRSLMVIFEEPELEAEYEHEYWTVRMAKQAALEMAFYGKIGVGNLDSILMMGPEQQNQVLELATHFTVNYEKKMGLLFDEAGNDMRLGYMKKRVGAGLKTLNLPEAVEKK